MANVAEEIVEELLKDLNARRGVGQTLRTLDEEIHREMKEALIEKTESVLEKYQDDEDVHDLSIGPRT
jgi:hypothetical protein